MDEARVQLAARARPALVRRWEERGVAAPYPLRIPSIRLGSIPRNTPKIENWHKRYNMDLEVSEV